MDRGAWWATVHGVTKSQTRLSDFPFLSLSYDLNQIPYNYTVGVANRFKGLDLIDRVPEELWIEVCDNVQEAVIRTIPKKKKCKKAKWLSEEGSQKDFSWVISNPKRWFCEVLYSVCQQIWKTQQWPQDWKRSVFIPIPKKGNAKECSSYGTIALISHASKVMLKVIQARLQQYMNHELPHV